MRINEVCAKLKISIPTLLRRQRECKIQPSYGKVGHKVMADYTAEQVKTLTDWPARKGE